MLVVIVAGLLTLLIMGVAVTGISILAWGLDHRRDHRRDRARRGMRADLRGALRDRRG